MGNSVLRVAYVVDTIFSAGAGTERQLLEMMQRFDRGRVQLHLICLRSSAWLEQHPLPVPSTILHYRGFLSPRIFACLRELRRTISVGKFDVVQTFFEDAFIATVVATTGLTPRPVLLASRRDIGLGSEHPWYHGIFRRLRPALLKRCDGVMVNALAVRQNVIEDGFDPGRIRVVPNGVETHLPSLPRPELFSAHPEAKWIVMAANLRPIKRHDLFLNALAKMRPDPVAPVHAVFLGTGPEEASLLQRAKQLGLEQRVHFAGTVNDVAVYLQHADVGVLCSDKEGLSNFVIEALANGLPMIVTGVGGNPELVDADVGAVVPPGDATALADAITQILGTPIVRNRMSVAARQRVRDRFSWEQTLTATENCYRSFLAASRQTGNNIG